jgi:hypothetical protein
MIKYCKPVGATHRISPFYGKGGQSKIVQARVLVTMSPRAKV